MGLGVRRGDYKEGVWCYWGVRFKICAHEHRLGWYFLLSGGLGDFL